MQKIKRFSYILMIVGVFTSCGEYQRVLNRGTIDEQYKMATKLYTTQKYKKALQLFKKLTPSFRGKPQMERIQFMVANCNYNEKDYASAAYYFGRFVNNYPKSSKVEEAEFLKALAYYKSSPAYSLDQTETNKALDAFQMFIDKYPSSSRIEEANEYYNKIKYKLEKKAFEIAKTYYRTADYDSRNYKAAITAFDNLLSDHLGTKFKEEALYYRFKSAHDYAMKSTFRRKPERIKDAIKAYEKLKYNFPKSDYLEDSDKLLSELKQEQEKIQQTIKG